MSTLKQVAQKAGVAPSTASAALRGLSIVAPQTTKKVMKAASELHYTVNIPARALQTGKTGILSLVIPSLDNSFYSKFAEAMSTAASKAGKSLIMQLTNYNRRSELNFSQQAGLMLSDGMIICNTQNSAQKLRSVVGSSFPLVVVDDYSNSVSSNCDYLYTPSQDGMLAVVRYLAMIGCTKMAIIGTSGKDIREIAQKNKDLGFHLQAGRGMYATQALDAFGIAHNDSSYFHVPWTVEAGIQVGENYAHAFKEGQARRFDAMICLNDQLALGVMHGLQTGGLRVPEDVAVTGFDGAIEGTYSTPSLTTVAVDYNGLAQSALQLISSRIESSDSSSILPRTVIVGFHLEKRASTSLRANHENAARQNTSAHNRTFVKKNA